jgi:hypothetical protein
MSALVVCTSCAFAATPQHALRVYEHDAGSQWPVLVRLHDECAASARRDGVTLVELSDYDVHCREYDCPACDSVQLIVDVHEGAPSMLGYGFDHDALDLECGHRITHSVLDGSEHVSEVPS